ncbi:MAG: hypothetical protein ACYSSL_01985 [Planctomycetota bacterium]|jgi:hypothetical protein
MISHKIFNLLAGVTICLALLTGGCAKTATIALKSTPDDSTNYREGLALLTSGCAKTATIALKFTPDDLTNYRIITESNRSVTFEGPLAAQSKQKGGTTGNKLELVFAQHIQDIDREGSAIAKITINQLKLLRVQKDQPVFDFDSAREKDRENPLVKLIGESYTVKIPADGRAATIVDTDKVNAKLMEIASKVAGRIFQPEAIERRHTCLPFLNLGNKPLEVGHTWRNTKSFDFNMLGTKTYEKVYTLNEIKSEGNQRFAIVEMNAIPSPETAAQSSQIPHLFLEKFDNTDQYTGRLKLELNSRKVENYSEKLESVWFIVDPAFEPASDKDPSAVRMAQTNFYSIEKLD